MIGRIHIVDRARLIPRERGGTRGASRRLELRGVGRIGRRVSHRQTLLCVALALNGIGGVDGLRSRQTRRKPEHHEAENNGFHAQ